MSNKISSDKSLKRLFEFSYNYDRTAYVCTTTELTFLQMVHSLDKGGHIFLHLSHVQAEQWCRVPLFSLGFPTFLGLIQSHLGLHELLYTLYLIIHLFRGPGLGGGVQSTGGI